MRATGRHMIKSTSVSGEIYGMEHADGSQSDTALGSLGRGIKKRRSSLSQRVVAILPSRRSRSTSQLSQTGEENSCQQVRRVAMVTRPHRTQRTDSKFPVYGSARIHKEAFSRFYLKDMESVVDVCCPTAALMLLTGFDVFMCVISEAAGKTVDRQKGKAVVRRIDADTGRWEDNR